jgi:hypothetical protein
VASQSYAKDDGKRVAIDMIGRHVSVDMSLPTALDAAANAATPSGIFDAVAMLRSWITGSFKATASKGCERSPTPAFTAA